MSNFALNINMFCDMIDQIIDYNKDFVARKGSMIAYLLLRVMQTKAKSKLAFSNIVMLTRVTLGAYIDLITLLNCPKLDWNLLEQQRARWEASQNIQQLELFPTYEGLLFEVKTKFACLKAVSNEY